MRVLVACEWSGVVREAFLRQGHDAWSCDLQHSGWYTNPDRHLRQDVRPLLRGPWDLVIAHPPCTYLSLSGVHWLNKRKGRWQEMEAACKFFNLCLDANAPRVCVENPIQHGYATGRIKKPWRQQIQPWQFGHGETKTTRLWLRGLPCLKPTNIVAGREQRVWKMPPGVDRQSMRSKTYQGIANAMAEQWGKG